MRSAVWGSRSGFALLCVPLVLLQTFFSTTCASTPVPSAWVVPVSRPSRSSCPLHYQLITSTEETTASSSRSSSKSKSKSMGRGGNRSVSVSKKEPKVLVDARQLQLSAEELAARFPDTDFNVPHTLPQALRVFFTNPSILIIGSGLVALAGGRAAVGGPWQGSETVAVGVVIVGWVLQEWAIHKLLLHNLPGWVGHTIHKEHHELPFFHISIDPPPIVIAWGVAFCSLAALTIPGPGLCLTVMLVYWGMGLLYEWSHYIVHTKVQPKTRLGKVRHSTHTYTQRSGIDGIHTHVQMRGPSAALHLRPLMVLTPFSVCVGDQAAPHASPPNGRPLHVRLHVARYRPPPRHHATTTHQDGQHQARPHTGSG